MTISLEEHVARANLTEHLEGWAQGHGLAEHSPLVAVMAAELIELRAAIAAVRELEGAALPNFWQPISAAPKDGTLFVALSQDMGGNDLPPFVSLCAWHSDAGFCTDELREPTHWMSIPNLSPPAPDPAEPWPPGDCHDPRSCAEHGECMYVGCPHSKFILPVRSPGPADAMRAKWEKLERATQPFRSVFETYPADRFPDSEIVSINVTFGDLRELGAALKDKGEGRMVKISKTAVLAAKLAQALDVIASGDATIRLLEEALEDHNQLLRSAFAAAQRDAIQETNGTTNYNLLAGDVDRVLDKHHATANTARYAIRARAALKGKGEGG